jgi:hypothetical protein
MKGIVNILLLLALIVSCEKEDSDYRDKFTGSYNFEIEHHYSILFNSSPSEIHIKYIDTVFSYSGKVTRSSDFENKILIDWGSDTLFRINGVTYTQKTEFVTDSMGRLNQLDPNWDSGGYFNGDTIKFYLYSYGALGGRLFSDWSVTGLKM